MEQRQKILDSYVRADLLNLNNEKHAESIIDLLKSNNDTIKEFMARLINTFASLNLGMLCCLKLHIHTHTNMDVFAFLKEDRICLEVVNSLNKC